ncbi:protein O-mannosyl-transferase family [Candidatus Latescibacterota bacterium]
MDTRKLNIIIAWSIFASILVIYLMTVAPTISFWDSGEFITCAYIMGIPHPPGSPLLALVGRVMSIIPFYDFRGSGFDHIAYRINLINVIAGAFTVMLTYLIVIRLITRMSPFRGSFMHDGIIMFSAAVSAFMAAFSHQFWENSIETETYISSLLLSVLAVWATLRWEERKNDPHAIRYLFLASFLIGLGNGIHLYVLLIAPTVFFIILTAKPDWFSEIRLWLGIAVVVFGFAVIRFAGGRLAFYLVMAVLALVGPFLLSRLYRSETRTWRITLLSMLLCFSLFVVGYSVYPTVMIRASKNPSINEGKPDTWTRYREYLERKQYGQSNMYAGMFDRNAELGYQFGFMYLRYLFQQFPKWGPSLRLTFTNDQSADYPGQEVAVEEQVYLSVFLWALILLGIAMHVRRDWKHFGAFFSFFILTSAGLVLYLNMKNPEVRERDYFFLGSFYIITVWVGLGIYALVSGTCDLLRRRNLHRFTKPVVLILMLLVSTMVPFAVLSSHIDPDYTNYQAHDRSRNFIPMDYGINLINSCEPNAILFTHGDNDTYPVWYAQEVLGLRRDVRVVNLSLLKAPWYIKQLRDEGVTIPITMTDDYIDNRLCGETLQAQRTLSWTAEPKEVTAAGITWGMPPTYISHDKSYGFLTVSNVMVYHIIETVNWTLPIYFAVTVEKSTKIGLDPFLTMEGMLFRLTKEKSDAVPYQINAPVLERNIFDVYTYRGVNDPTVYKAPETAKLLGNYFISFIDLCDSYTARGDRVNAVRAARAGMEKCSPDLLRRILLYTIMKESGFTEELEVFIDTEIERLSLYDLEASIAVGANFFHYSLNRAAERMFKKIVEHHPHDVEVWKVYVEVLYQTGKYQEALTSLESLLALAPDDSEAMRLRELILKNHIREIPGTDEYNQDN